MSKRVLIICIEEEERDTIRLLFEEDGFEADSAGSAEKGIALAEAGAYDVIISDAVLPGMDGAELFTQMQEQDPAPLFIALADGASLDASVRAIRAGAYDYVLKPVVPDKIKRVVSNALRQQDLLAENALLRRECGEKLSIEEYTKAFIRKYEGEHTEQQLADLLGITRKSLWEKRKKWGMRKERS